MIFGREPVLVLAIVNTAIALAAILYPERLPVEVQAGIIALSTAILSFWARAKVTPV